MQVAGRWLVYLTVAVLTVLVVVTCIANSPRARLDFLQPADGRVPLETVFDFPWDEVCVYANRAQPVWRRGDNDPFRGDTPFLGIFYGASSDVWGLVFFRGDDVVHREQFGYSEATRDFPYTRDPTKDSSQCAARSSEATVSVKTTSSGRVLTFSAPGNR